MKRALSFFSLFILSFSIISFIGCAAGNHPSAVNDVNNDKFVITKSAFANPIDPTADRDTFFVQQTIFCRLLDKLSLLPQVDSTVWFADNVQVSSGKGLPTGPFKFNTAGERDIVAWVFMKNGSIEKAYDKAFVIISDTVIYPTPADSIFNKYSSVGKNDGTYDVTFGAWKPLADMNMSEEGAGYQGNLTPSGWGTVYDLNNVSPSGRLYLFTVNLKNKTFYQVQLCHAHKGNIVITPYTKSESDKNRFYVASVDNFRFFHYNGNLYRSDSLPDTVEAYKFPYNYGDPDSLKWVTGFIDSPKKDSVTIYGNLKLTGQTTGAAYLINKTTVPIVKIPLTVVDAGNYGYVKMAIADMHSTLGLIWSFERNGVEIPLNLLKNSSCYADSKQALWGIWSPKRGQGSFVPFL